MPNNAETQAKLAWRNMEAQLKAAGIVKTTTIVRHEADIPAVRSGRSAVLGSHKAASTMIVAGLSNLAWKVEVEGIAAAA